MLCKNGLCFGGVSVIVIIIKEYIMTEVESSYTITHDESHFLVLLAL